MAEGKVTDNVFLTHRAASLMQCTTTHPRQLVGRMRVSGEKEREGEGDGRRERVRGMRREMVKGTRRREGA